jgi:hypothetical protein
MKLLHVGGLEIQLVQTMAHVEATSGGDIR